MLADGGSVHGNREASLKSMLAEYERGLILQALAAVKGHQRRAAALLGILPTTLHEKMKRLSIPTRMAGLRGEGLGQEQPDRSHAAA